MFDVPIIRDGSWLCVVVRLLLRYHNVIQCMNVRLYVRLPRACKETTTN